jgi:hypothetical protein
MPGDLLDRLGVQRLRRVSLVLADGRRAQRDVGEAMASVDTSKPAIRGQVKTGHRSGRSRPDVL